MAKTGAGGLTLLGGRERGEGGGGAQYSFGIS